MSKYGSKTLYSWNKHQSLNYILTKFQPFQTAGNNIVKPEPGKRPEIICFGILDLQLHWSRNRYAETQNKAEAEGIVQLGCDLPSIKWWVTVNASSARLQKQWNCFWPVFFNLGNFQMCILQLPEFPRMLAEEFWESKSTYLKMVWETLF